MVASMLVLRCPLKTLPAMTWCQNGSSVWTVTVEMSARKSSTHGVRTNVSLVCPHCLSSRFRSSNKAILKMLSHNLTVLTSGGGGGGGCYVDLYLIHWPVAFKEDTVESMPRDANGILILSDADYLDTWKEMELLVEKGFTKSIGVSNFNSEQLQRLVQTEGLKYVPVTNQVEINPYILNNKLISFCREKGIAITAYSPLGSSDHRCFRSDAAFRRLFDEPSLQELDKKYGKTVAQVVLRWGLQRDTIVIPKSVTPSRIKENFQVFDFQLTEEEMNVDRNFRACAFATMSKSQHYPFYIEF
ncbi:aldo-keto reductase family 1 member B1-like [Haliotis cracherodii]|uniref:aldo-keto reductase family 1 member B1-like n=1 Tax=Haliotis cracherodii TaxID=6455 RepID=UPI0039E9241E